MLDILRATSWTVCCSVVERTSPVQVVEGTDRGPNGAKRSRGARPDRPAVDLCQGERNGMKFLLTGPGRPAARVARNVVLPASSTASPAVDLPSNASAPASS